MKNSARIAFVMTTSLTLALAACAPTPAPAPSASESVTPGPSPSSEPTTPVADPADPGMWIISEAGIGPIAIGGDFATTLTDLPDGWSNDAASCSWTASWNAEDSSHGLLFVRGGEVPAAPIREISLFTAAETPTRIDGPETAEGLGIGSTADEILAAHPDAEQGAALIGMGSWIRLAGDGEAHVFFEFREGVTGASSVAVTIGEEPSYEVCG